jgi:hypothetical protein
MEYRAVTKDDVTYILTEGSAKLQTEQDALDLVAACGENDTQRLLLLQQNLSDDFFRLRTGLAGTVLQKFANYFVSAAAVVSPEKASLGKFGEMVTETNRGRQFRVFTSMQEAEEWLLRVTLMKPF